MRLPGFGGIGYDDSRLSDERVQGAIDRGISASPLVVFMRLVAVDAPALVHYDSPRRGNGGISVTNEELTRAVKAAVGHAYDRYFARLRQLRPEDTPAESELVSLSQETVAEIIRIIDAAPAAARLGASKLALAITMRWALEMLNTTQRVDREAAKRRRRFSDN